jgi:hypothetical protein
MQQKTSGKRAENATTGEPIGIDATMGISILKSTSWLNATINQLVKDEAR